MASLCILLFLVLGVPAIIKACSEAAKKKEMEEFRQQHPELWVQLQQMEHEQILMQQQEDQQKKQLWHDQVKTGANIGFQLAQWLVKK